MSEQALDGMVIIALEHAVAGPYCSRLLAEAGARVIKLERAEGDFARAYDKLVKDDSAYFVWLNGGKESVVVDLTKDADQILMHNLLKRADVFIQNLRPGAVDRLGFGYSAVNEINQNLVMCSISGYGQSGEYAQMKAYDTLIQAETGLGSITGLPGRPCKVGASIVDTATGLSAYGEILKALIKRGRDGHGAHIELSLFEVMAEWMAVPLSSYEYGDKLLGGTGFDHAHIAPCGAYKTADGLIIIVIQNEREWTQLCRDVLEAPALADDERYNKNVLRVENKDALRVEIEAYFKRFNRAEMAAKLHQGGIAFGNINDMSDLQRHPALKRRTVETSGNKISLVRRVGDTTERSPHIPKLDEHGPAIRAEFRGDLIGGNSNLTPQ
ncbi:MAG: CaiB/BaiF CoA-transferase family protein [Gammaproteobacteria bacterium]